MRLHKGKYGKAGMLLLAVVLGLAIGFVVGRISSGSRIGSGQVAPAIVAGSNPDGVSVGGSKLVPSRDIPDNAANAKNLTTFVAAIKAADLAETLKSPGPYTLFAPTNEAFTHLPAGTIDILLKPANKEPLVKIINYHIVSGTYTTADLRSMAAKGQTLSTLQGGTLTPVLIGSQVALQDAKSNKFPIETPDIVASNGILQVISGVLTP